MKLHINDPVLKCHCVALKHENDLAIDCVDMIHDWLLIGQGSQGKAWHKDIYIKQWKFHLFPFKAELHRTCFFFESTAMFWTSHVILSGSLRTLIKPTKESTVGRRSKRASGRQLKTTEGTRLPRTVACLEGQLGDKKQWSLLVVKAKLLILVESWWSWACFSTNLNQIWSSVDNKNLNQLHWFERQS